MSRMMEAASEVAGTVLEVTASLGATLAEGDQILVLESMKMEIPVLAPAAGRLVEVFATEGESVAEGQVLARIEV